MLYLADLSRDDPFFGAVKLCKLLYYCDFRAFAVTGDSITGASYQKQPKGPVPIQFFAERDALVADGEALLKSEMLFHYIQHRLEPTQDCSGKAELFSGQELRIVHRVHDELKGMTANQVSDLSHKEPGWILTDDYEVIPYETVLILSPDNPEVLQDTAVRAG